MTKYPYGVNYIRTKKYPYRVFSQKEDNMSEQMELTGIPERKKHRTEEEKKNLIKRLHMAEGQIRGIERMVEENAYCPDIMVQVSAVTSALNAFNKELLAAHIRSCVTEDIREDNTEAINEFVKLMQKLMR